MFENKIKKLLAQGKPAWGAGLPQASDLIAKLTIDTGIDFLWIDTEHVPYSFESISMIPIICRRNDCVPMIRVAGLDPVLIKKALDIGASTLVIPQVNSAEEARLGVSYAKYPPQGSRGASPTWTFFMDVSYDDYLPAANGETCVVVQIETPDGIKNLEAIAEVEGVDVLLAGPLDLSASLGHIGQIDHPAVQEFLEEFPQRVAKAGKSSGIALGGIEAAQKAYERGYRFINFGNVLWQGKVSLTKDIKQLREMTTN